ncbi:MAG TPA: hypothetical protein VHI13_00405 [Candidatus Kapabacteria bacterium]|nr:hypothetical protein [Candidatus Kapabacteria bacterium]
MRITTAILSSVLLSLLLSHSAKADGLLIAWSMTDVPGFTEEMFNAAKKQSTADIVRKNPQVQTWSDAVQLLVGASQHTENKAFLRSLAAQLSDTSFVSMRETSRLIIWERITSGEILFEGKGLQVEDDLFTVAGRANWILRNLTSKNFGYVKPHASAAELEQLGKRWSQWMSGKQVAEYNDPYASSQKGLEEIRSPQALEALIMSLRPGSAKQQLTMNCLKTLYNLDKLPEDSNSPAILCNPDSYTNGYLRSLTGVADVHDFEWWKSWWEEHRNGLRWNAATAMFETQG